MLPNQANKVAADATDPVEDVYDLSVAAHIPPSIDVNKAVAPPAEVDHAKQVMCDLDWRPNLGRSSAVYGGIALT